MVIIHVGNHSILKEKPQWGEHPLRERKDRRRSPGLTPVRTDLSSLIG